MTLDQWIDEADYVIVKGYENSNGVQLFWRLLMYLNNMIYKIHLVERKTDLFIGKACV